MFSSYAGRGTSSLQSSGGELDHPPSSARSSSLRKFLVGIPHLPTT